MDKTTYAALAKFDLIGAGVLFSPDDGTFGGALARSCVYVLCHRERERERVCVFACLIA